MLWNRYRSRTRSRRFCGVALQAQLLERLLEDDEHRVHVERLDEVVLGARAHRLDRRLDARERGHHHEHGVGALLARALEERDAVHARHADVGEDRRRREPGEQRERLLAVRRLGDLVPLLGEDGRAARRARSARRRRPGSVPCPAAAPVFAIGHCPHASAPRACAKPAGRAGYAHFEGRDPARRPQIPSRRRANAARHGRRPARLRRRPSGRTAASRNRAPSASATRRQAASESPGSATALAATSGMPAHRAADELLHRGVGRRAVSGSGRARVGRRVGRVERDARARRRPRRRGRGGTSRPSRSDREPVGVDAGPAPRPRARSRRGELERAPPSRRVGSPNPVNTTSGRPASPGRRARRARPPRRAGSCRSRRS